ncbi:MAG: NtaA/DmoA family FMN-dependent monooxygenase [Xenophilus sp.]
MTTTREKRERIILGVSFWPTGATSSGWRTGAADNSGVFNPDALARAARKAESGVFDYFFLGNSYFSDGSQPGSVIRRAFQLNGFAAASYLAGQTRNIGLVATVNSTLLEPFHVAQLAVSTDHLTRGRFGLNIVTGAGNDPSYRNFSLREHPGSAERYARAREFAEVLAGLEDSWAPDWFVDDKTGGRLINEKAPRAIHFRGRHFQVEGPLNAPPPPAGRIPLVAAGASEESIRFGGQFADIRFSPFVNTAWNQRWYRAIKEAVAAAGRHPDEHKIVSGTVFYAGETNAAARELFRAVEAGVVEGFGPNLIARTFGVPRESITPHGRVLDVLRLDGSDTYGIASNDRHAIGAFDISLDLREVIEAYGSEDVTFLDLFRFLTNRAHFPVIVGDKKRIADWIESNFHDRAFDGVKFFPPYQFGPFESFVDLVVPELQRRGLARARYDTATLRGHLGLPTRALTPASREPSP